MVLKKTAKNRNFDPFAASYKHHSKGKILKICFAVLSFFRVVSTRFWGAGSKYDECQNGTLRRFEL